MHSKVHSLRVCFVRPRNFPAMSIFFPPCQDLLCEAAGFCACCERTNNFCKYEFKNIAALNVFCFSDGSLKSFVGWECLL